MKNLLNRWLPSLTLASWSGILFYFYLSGRLASFLHPNFRPGVLVAAIVLLLFAAGSAFGGSVECCEESACGHSVARFTFGKLLTFGILFLPLALVFGNSRDAFGLNTIENRGVVMDASALVKSGRAPSGGGTPDQFVPKTASGNIDVSVIDLLYAAQDEGLRKDFDGKTVELVGQLMEEKVDNPRGNRMKVVRMFMSCCAADAKPIAALVELPTLPDVPVLSWVRVVGTPVFPMEGGKTIAVLKADSMKVTDPPDETMLY